MKILIFNWRDIRHSWAGGGEIYIFEQAKRWVKKGHKVTVFCGEDFDNKLPEREVIDGIDIYRKGGRYSLYLWATWYYLTKFRGNYDILIDVVNGIPFFSPVFSRLPKICIVYHVHGKQFFYELPHPINYLGYFTEKYLFPLIYRNTPIIAISLTTRKQLQKYGFLKNNIKIVYCGINGKSKTGNSTGRRFNHPTILYLGRIKKYKRVDLLVEIFPKILEKVPNARLIIAGWGTEASNVADIVMKSSLRRKISLMGPVNHAEKRDLLTKSWLFVNPSIGEGWSMAVIEANLHGTPAVSFNVPGLSESIQNGVTGLLAENTDDFINHICMVLKHKNLCDKLGKKAKTRAERYSWDRSANQSIRIMNKYYNKD